MNDTTSSQSPLSANRAHVVGPPSTSSRVMPFPASEANMSLRSWGGFDRITHVGVSPEKTFAVFGMSRSLRAPPERAIGLRAQEGGR